jgi:hypothetical protein
MIQPKVQGMLDMAWTCSWCDNNREDFPDLSEADFIEDREERLSVPIIQVNSRTAIATRRHMVQGT